MEFDDIDEEDLANERNRTWSDTMDAIIRDQQGRLKSLEERLIYQFVPILFCLVLGIIIVAIFHSQIQSNDIAACCCIGALAITYLLLTYLSHVRDKRIVLHKTEERVKCLRIALIEAYCGHRYLKEILEATEWYWEIC